MYLRFFVLALVVALTTQQRTTKPTTTFTTTKATNPIEAKCTGNWCPTTPRPCSGFGCPPTTTEKAYPTPTVNRAIVAFNVGNDISGIHGFLELAQDGPFAPVRINGMLHGLSPSKRQGFHIHETGDIREGCGSVGEHFSAGRIINHGIPGNVIRHVGDLGNIQVNAYGIASISMSDSMISLNGENSIIGRTFVIHEKEDDGGRGSDAESRLSGNTGLRMACGIVGISKM